MWEGQSAHVRSIASSTISPFQLGVRILVGQGIVVGLTQQKHMRQSQGTQGVALSFGPFADGPHPRFRLNLGNSPSPPSNCQPPHLIVSTPPSLYPLTTVQTLLPHALKFPTRRCLQKDAALRPSARDLLQHPFVATATEPPAALGGMAGELARRRLPLKSRR